MKKFISVLLLLTLVAGLFAGCVGSENPTDPSTPTTDSLADAVAYVQAMYKDMDGTKAIKEFTLTSVVRIDGVSYSVTWTADNDAVTISSVDNNTIQVSFDTAPTEQIDFTLTATIADANGKTGTTKISRYVEAVKASGVEIVEKPVDGSSYKFSVAQNEETVNQTIYFTGEMDGYYLGTTTNPFEAVDIVVEEVDGGYHLYFVKDEVKTYIDIVERDGEENKGKVNVKLVEAPTCVFTWNEEFKTFITEVAGGEWYLGCYKTYTTISASATSYINSDNVDVSQFPARLVNVNIAPVVSSEPKADTAYKFHVAQNEETVNKAIYFTGAMDGFYLGTTTNPGEAVNVYVEAVDGGYHIYFNGAEGKTYIDIVERDGEENKGKVNVKLVAEPTCVFTWNEEFKTFITEVAGGEWYLGCYKTYTTISASATSYINSDNVDVSQFPARLATVDGFMDEPIVEG